MFLNDLKYSSRQGPAASEFTSIFSIHLAKILKKEGKKDQLKNVATTDFTSGIRY